MKQLCKGGAQHGAHRARNHHRHHRDLRDTAVLLAEGQRDGSCDRFGQQAGQNRVIHAKQLCQQPNAAHTAQRAHKAAAQHRQQVAFQQVKIVVNRHADRRGGGEDQKADHVAARIIIFQRDARHGKKAHQQNQRNQQRVCQRRF
ncbi:hypothetical protein SDC9_140193 [bioreactor metagenome]|uniref:Uncharacterized protein n=1 Tax=bioreactor metagenome TaxID=1076179 RepID=A0A645DUJ8_9ZZZZ